VTVKKLFPLRFARTPRAFAVFPLDDSIISLSPLFLIIPRAVLSFTDQKGLRYSSFAYILTQLNPCTSSSMRRSGVFPIFSIIEVSIIVDLISIMPFYIVS